MVDPPAKRQGRDNRESSLPLEREREREREREKEREREREREREMTMHLVTALPRVWQHLNMSDVSLGTRPRYSLFVDEDFNKRNQPTNKKTCI